MIEAGGGEERALLLGGYAVGTDAIGAFEGFDGEAHLLAQAAGDEAADAARGGGVEATKQWTNKLPLR